MLLQNRLLNYEVLLRQDWFVLHVEIAGTSVAISRLLLLLFTKKIFIFMIWENKFIPYNAGIDFRL